MRTSHASPDVPSSVLGLHFVRGPIEVHFVRGLIEVHFVWGPIEAHFVVRGLIEVHFVRGPIEVYLSNEPVSWRFGRIVERFLRREVCERLLDRESDEIGIHADAVGTNL